jgi:16S rRNA C967 or C1407 C5-methylase (RsmB/RsmF family)
VRAADRAGASRIVKARVADFLKLDPFGDEFASVRAVLLDPSCSGSGTASADVDASISAAAVAAAEDDLAAKEEKGEEEEREREKRRKRRRLDKLAEFQLSALKHALRFPNARRVAYSTCSVHAEENERVVAAALAWLSGGEGEATGDGEAGEEEKKKRRKKERKKAGSPSDAAAAVASSSSPSSLSLPKGWRLARALPEWPTRGISEGEGAEGEEGGCLLSLSPDDAAKVLRAHPATDATDGFFVAVFERCEGDGER